MDKLLLYEYQNVLLGKQDSLNQMNFISNYQSQKNAKELFQYVIEKLLRWTPEECLDRFNADVIKKMKLEPALSMVPFPPELDNKSDFYFIIYWIYPKRVVYNFKQSVIRTYRCLLASYLKPNQKAELPSDDPIIIKLKQDKNISKILEDSQELIKFPKEYMNESDGRIRSGICLQYALNEFMMFHNVEEMYKYFSNAAESMAMLKKLKLAPVCQDLYDNPLEYLHYSLPDSQKNNLLYSYYIFAANIDPKKEKIKKW